MFEQAFKIMLGVDKNNISRIDVVKKKFLINNVLKFSM